MKKLLFSALTLATALTASAQTTTPTTSNPVVTITTPAINTHSDLIITGTATDTGTSTGTGGGATTTAAGVKAVYYQIDGSSKWRKATLTAKGTASTTWLVQFRNKSSVGKRIFFRAVDVEGNESDIVGRRFKRGS